MYPLVAGRKITARRRDDGELAAFRSHYFNLGPNRIPIALVSDKSQGQPMVSGGSVVVQNMGLTIVSRNHCIHSPIIINVASRQSACNPGVRKNTPRTGGDINKPAPRISCQQHWFAIAK